MFGSGSATERVAEEHPIGHNRRQLASLPLQREKFEKLRVRLPAQRKRTPAQEFMEWFGLKIV